MLAVSTATTEAPGWTEGKGTGARAGTRWAALPRGGDLQPQGEGMLNTQSEWIPECYSFLFSFYLLCFSLVFQQITLNGHYELSTFHLASRCRCLPWYLNIQIQYIFQHNFMLIFSCSIKSVIQHCQGIYMQLVSIMRKIKITHSCIPQKLYW